MSQLPDAQTEVPNLEQRLQQLQTEVERQAQRIAELERAAGLTASGGQPQPGPQSGT